MRKCSSDRKLSGNQREIELDDEHEEFKKPPWLGQEVTADIRYLNSNLAINPFKEWH